MKITPPFLNCLGFCAFAFLALAGAASCGSDDAGHDDGHDGGTTKGSGAVCPSGSTLTYDTFGSNFMQTYCTRCHSSTATDRQGAPTGHDFDTLAGIRKVIDHIDEQAAAGPKSTNTVMPPSDPKPSDEARQKLGQWLACEQSGNDGGGTTGDSGGTGDGGNRDATGSDGRGDR